ncbi:hypothetical protein Bca52824_039370 [Brassica carinata]|uniref:Trichome birefringence-like C-terminal domain-containing protein n=1 Tax=Brassica carinata TaxID=52824 RepID=A0A8X7UY28_BRACI|nr:hypothetical protein Bca52824_039370 [Brassica carinata]
MESVAITEHLIKLLPVAEPGLFDLVGYVISAVEGKPYQSLERHGRLDFQRWGLHGRYKDMNRLVAYYKGMTRLDSGRDWGEPMKSLIRRLKKLVYWLDITGLSQLRKDAYPSAYSGNHPGNDCSHWCLPGLPDTWNVLFYSAFFS